MIKLTDLLHNDPNHIYSEAELDAIEEIDEDMAYRLARTQALAQQKISFIPTDDPVTLESIEKAMIEIQKILSHDGGDIELVKLEEKIVYVRMMGACVGCPNAVLDLKNVVERIIRKHAPGVLEIKNVF